MKEKEKIWVEKIVDVFRILGNRPSHLSEIYDYIEKTNTNLIETWQATIRGRIEENSSDTDSYIKKRDYFYAFGGLGNGIWGLREHLNEDVDVIKQLYSIKWELPLEELRAIAITKAKKELTPEQRKSFNYNRSQAIRLYALKRANGICEACKKEAPFKTKEDKPFLEVHHIGKLIDGGADDPEWVIALCPNCHRKAHYSKESVKFNDMLQKIIEQKERDIVNFE